jgi:hypothetical protein
MRLTMKEKRSITKVIADRYKKASKKEKSVILDEFIKLTGYNRGYGSWLLASNGKTITVAAGLSIQGDLLKPAEKVATRIYDDQVVVALLKLWMIMDQICGKRLAAILPELIPRLEACGELKLAKATPDKFLKISAATIDRLLAAERRKMAFTSRSKTKPGSLLKSQIPIRTFAEWDDLRLRFVEIDLVAHDGGAASGDYLQTLSLRN